jgi:hypothetical protein
MRSFARMAPRLTWEFLVGLVFLGLAARVHAHHHGYAPPGELEVWLPPVALFVMSLLIGWQSVVGADGGRAILQHQGRSRAGTQRIAARAERLARLRDPGSMSVALLSGIGVLAGFGLLAVLVMLTRLLMARRMRQVAVAARERLARIDG